jgi:hypothetical protein
MVTKSTGDSFFTDAARVTDRKAVESIVRVVEKGADYHRRGESLFKVKNMH